MKKIRGTEASGIRNPDGTSSIPMDGWMLSVFRIRGNFNSVNLVFPINFFAMFFHINYSYYIIRNVTIFFLHVNSIFKDNFFSSWFW